MLDPFTYEAPAQRILFGRGTAWEGRAPAAERQDQATGEADA